MAGRTGQDRQGDIMSTVASFVVEPGEACHVRHEDPAGPITFATYGAQARLTGLVTVRLDEDGWRQLTELVELRERERIGVDRHACNMARCQRDATWELADEAGETRYLFCDHHHNVGTTVPGFVGTWRRIDAVEKAAKS